MSELLVPTVCAVAIFVLAGSAQAVTGFGLALIAVPLLAIVVDPVPAIVATTMIGVVLTFVAATRESAHVDRAVASTLAWTGIVGMPIGLLVLLLLGPDQLTVLVAVVLLVLVVALWANLRVPFTRSTLWSAGVVSGALLTSTGMNGPPLVVVLDGARMSPRRFRATLQVVFCVQDLAAVIGFAIIGHISVLTFAVTAGGLVGIPLGWWLGDRVFRSIAEDTFRRVILIALVCTAVVAVVQALI